MKIRLLIFFAILLAIALIAASMLTLEESDEILEQTAYVEEVNE